MAPKKIFIAKEKIEDYLKSYSLQQIADKEGCSIWTIMKLIKQYELKPLGASHFNKGCNNPAKRKEVKDKISIKVKGLWDNDVYKDRINGMLYKFDWEHHNYKPKNHYREYIQHYQKLECYYCGAAEQERKIDIHHLDENHDNWLLSNLLPVCNVCHGFFHFKRYKSPFVTIAKAFYFENAHHLLNYTGACENNHGHSYYLQVFIEGPINRDTGLCIDYKNLKEIVEKYIIEIFDHKTSNDFMDCNPTVENMLFFMWDRLEKEGLVKGLQKILLKETNSSEAYITKEHVLNYYNLNRHLILKEAKEKNVLKSENYPDIFDQ